MALNRFWNLLAKKLSGEALPEELSELEQLMKEHPDWLFPADHIEQIWKLRTKDADSYDAELAFELHLHEQRRKGLEFPELETPEDLKPVLAVQKPRRSFRWVVLSVLALVAGFFAFRYWQHTPPKAVAALNHNAGNEVSTRAGSKMKLVLPDSSVVWLNAGSKIRYEEGFGTNHRNAILTGEAFFDVRKGTIPFIIKAGSIQIKVMGTAFNVKSYPNEKNTETSLIHGRIEVTLDKRPGARFVLRPNEKLIVANDIEPMKPGETAEHRRISREPMVVLSGLTRTPEEVIVETSWVDNRLVFQDEAFSEIARKLERWYNVSIRIDDPRIAEMRLTGAFENETLLQALEALQIAFPFNFKMTDSVYIITK